MGEITLAFAKRKFGQVLENINNFGNPVREVVSIPLTKEENVQLALAQVGSIPPHGILQLSIFRKDRAEPMDAT